MKGVILAGGTGSRLKPASLVVSKQLLPVYDKPMIYYPLSTLIHAGCSEILIISTPKDLPRFKELLDNGEHFGISIKYAEQIEPRGVAEGLRIAKNFVMQSEFWFILGDNLFHGPAFGRNLSNISHYQGAFCFSSLVNNPSDYGIVKYVHNSNQIEKIVEKPQKFISNWAIPGLYYFDNSAIERSYSLKPSLRNELEIIDLLKLYLSEEKLKIEKVSRGNTWFDLGTPNSLLRASEFVQIVQERQGMLVGSPEEASFNAGFLTINKLREYLISLGNKVYQNTIIESTEK